MQVGGHVGQIPLYPPPNAQAIGKAETIKVRKCMVRNGGTRVPYTRFVIVSRVERSKLSYENDRTVLPADLQLNKTERGTAGQDSAPKASVRFARMAPEDSL